MTFDPEDYEIEIHTITPAYRSTLPRDANRKDTDQEAQLSSITIEVRLRAGRSTSEEYREMFEAEFAVDHENYEVRFKRVGDSHENRHAFDPEKFWYVSEFAAEVVGDWMDDVGLMYEPPLHSVTMWDHPPKPSVHTELETDPRAHEDKSESGGDDVTMEDYNGGE